MDGADLRDQSGTLLIFWSGLNLLLQRFGGLYWLVPTTLIYSLWSLNNTWLLAAQVADEETQMLNESCC